MCSNSKLPNAGKWPEIARHNLRRFLPGLFLMVSVGLSSGWSQTIHLLNPWAEDPERAELVPYFRGADGSNWYPGTEMTNEGGDWWSYTFQNTMPASMPSQFAIVSGTPPNFQDAQFFVPGGVVATEPGHGTWFDWNQIQQDYPDVTDIYIYQPDSSQVVVTDIPPSSKAIFILNPWTVSAPTISLNGGEYEGMRLSDHCEWFVYYVNGDSSYNVHFREIFGTSVYGAAGGADATPIDLNAHFATYDSAYIYPDTAPDGAPVISPTYPGFDGICGFNLAATVRDFCVGDDNEPTADCPNPHPDFEPNFAGNGYTEGMVDVNLGSDRKPVNDPAVDFFQDHFDQWFNTVPDVNAETCVDIPMTKTQGGLWEYDSYNEPSKGFFPIDDFTEIGASERYSSTYEVRGGGGFWDDPTGAEHNFHFCLEMHASFVYKPGVTPEKGQAFIFEGDDDVWVFIDDMLVIDLGGLHLAIADTLMMDDIAGSFGWNAGDTLPFDFFLCERHTTSSNMWIQSSIYFEQGVHSWVDTVVINGNRVRYDVWRRIGQEGTCGSASTGDTTVPETANYELTGTGIVGQRDLSTAPVAGITIGSESTNITIDTAAIRQNNSLPPGSYVLTIRTRNRPMREFRIPFTVSGQVELVQRRLQSIFNVGLNPLNQLTFQLKKQAVLEFEIYGVNGKRLWKHPRTSFKAGKNVVPLNPSAVGENLRFLRIKSEGQTNVKMLAPVGP